MTDLLAQDGGAGYDAESNSTWTVSILPIEVINHFTNLEISPGSPDDDV